MAGKRDLSIEDIAHLVALTAESADPTYLYRAVQRIAA
jgi:hypothetical protein